MTSKSLAVLAGIVALVWALMGRTEPKPTGELSVVERFNRGDLTFSETLDAISAMNQANSPTPTVRETGNINPESGTAGTVIVDPDPSQTGDEIHIENPYGSAPPGSEGL